MASTRPLTDSYEQNRELGIGSTGDTSVPTEVSGLPAISAVAAGGGASLVVGTDGTVWAFGDNSWGALGTNAASQSMSDVPVQVQGLSSIVAVAVGSDFALALSSTGQVFTWGDDQDGQLGNGSTLSTPTPTPVALGLTHVTAIAAGGSHAIALEAVNSAGQALYAWGDNAEGELGQGSTTDAARPKLVPGVTAAVAIAAGTSDSYALGATGSVLAMGDASAGELPGLAASVSSPTTLTLPAGTDPVSLAASGEDLYVEADQNGAFGLLGYGADADGQLGEPSAPASGVTSLGLSPALFSASASHLAVVLSGGEVAGLGEGTEGQLGQGTTASSQSLVGASGLVAFVPLAASGALSESTTDDTYDADGLRVLSETAASATPATWFGIGDDPQLLCQGATDFLYGPDGEVDEQELTDQDATPTYLIHDQAGSTRLLTDQAGNVVGTASYDPYGNPTAKWGETTPIGYSGGDTDPTGLVYLVHRYYDPQTGEFLSLDPLVAETMEPYAYGGDDPENEGDPSGLGLGICVLGHNPNGSCRGSSEAKDVVHSVADLGAGIANGGAQIVDDLPTITCVVASGGNLITGLDCASSTQPEWSAHVNLHVGVPYQDSGALGDFEDGEYAFGTAWGEVAATAGGGELACSLEGASSLLGEAGEVEGAEGAASAPETEGSVPNFIPGAATDQVPDDWGPGQATQKGGGWRWTDPENQGNGVRIDPGNPNSSFPSQQIDHIVVRSDGQILGHDGDPVTGPLSQNPQAHIPLSQWEQWQSWNTP